MVVKESTEKSGLTLSDSDGGPWGPGKGKGKEASRRLHLTAGAQIHVPLPYCFRFFCTNEGRHAGPPPTPFRASSPFFYLFVLYVCRWYFDKLFSLRPPLHDFWLPCAAASFIVFHTAGNLICQHHSPFPPFSGPIKLIKSSTRSYGYSPQASPFPFLYLLCFILVAPRWSL